MATKDDISEVKAEMAELRAEFKSDVHSLRADAASDIANLQAKDKKTCKELGDQIVGCAAL